MIDIYGDSFADPAVNPIGYGGFRPWHERLGKVRNFAKSSTGPHYSLRELYKCYKKYTKDDHIIFIISGHDRIHFHVPEEFKQKDRICPEDAMWDTGRQRITLYKEHNKKPQEKQKWYDKHNQHMDYACRTFQEEIDTLTEKCESFLYMISRLQQCKVTVFLLHANCSYMGDRLNDDLFYLHNYSLMDASNEEFIEFDANRFPRWELRQNHFSRENHDIMEDIIRTRIFKPFKKSFIDSTPFEHHEVPGSFIYD